MPKPGPRAKFCYICERSASQCTSLSPCRTLTGAEKKKAYDEGYARAKHKPIVVTPQADFSRPKPLPPEVVEKHSPRGLVPSSAFAEMDTPYVEFLGEVNPRENKDAQFALAASTDMRFREFVNVCMDRKYRNMSLATIAKKLDISLPEFADFWRKAGHARGLALAASGLASMTQDMLGDAATHHEMCERCDALGWVAALPLMDPEPAGYRFMGDGPDGELWARTCPACEGAGRIRKAGDSHARDKILMMNGFGQKGGGVTVAINNYAGMGIESGLGGMGAVSFEVGELQAEVVEDGE